MRLLLTGATGFLGQRVLRYALARGHELVVVARAGRPAEEMPWAGDERVTLVEADLASDAAAEVLAAALAGVDAVIHAAGALIGDDAAQRRDTVEPTRRLLDAMHRVGCRRLVLVSSLSVYGYAALPAGAQLDETTPTEPDPDQRDAYCRAKLAQEALALAAAQRQGLVVTALRPGMIYGPGRWWGARLGMAKGPLCIVLGGHAALPLCHVEHCAEAVVLAAERQPYAGDVHVVPDEGGYCGAFEAINVIDDAQPTQREYLAALRRRGAAPRLTLLLPWGLLQRVAGLAALGTMLLPPLRARLPGLLRPASLHARCKPLRFSNCRLHDRLDWCATVAWEDAIAATGTGVVDGRR
jgi:nucleoside-diphosphate-sugar epimerase